MYKLLLLLVAFFSFTNLHSASPDDWKPEKGKHYEIYLCAGQSNMDGRAKSSELVKKNAKFAKPQKDLLIRYTSGGLHRKLRSSTSFIPLAPGCSESPDHFGPELGFGRTLADAHKGANILLIKVAEGGTNLHTDWNPSAPNKLYATLIAQTRETLTNLENAGATGTVSGIIWMQGESDNSKNHADKYQQRLTALINQFRSDLKSPNLPFVIGQICEANPEYQSIIAAQKLVATSIPYTALASSSNLTTSDQNVHFDASAQIELGTRFAKKIIKLQNPQK